MKTLKQLHDDEQREARIAAAYQEFRQQMHNIEADYLRNVERSRRFHRCMMLAITIAAGLAILLPALAFTWRLL